MIVRFVYSVEKITKMQEVYDFSSINNSEIKFRWIRLGLKSKWEGALPLAAQMVSEQGRMKFLRPIYRYIAVAVILHSLAQGNIKGYLLLY